VGGTFAYAYPRLRTWAAMRGDGPDPEVLEARVRRLHVNTLVFDPALLALCLERYGGGRVMFGSDDPFIPWDAVTAPLAAAGPAVRADNAAAF
jgi:predicted TIM-barrel fold metal-dependent hydrolase